MPECDQARRGRILVTDDGTLLAAGVQDLLGQCPGIDVCAVTLSRPADLIAQVERVQPDMIVLACDGPGKAPSYLLTLLRQYPSVRIVAMSSSCNTVAVYDRSTATVASVGDLLALIPQPGPASSEPACDTAPR
jgi:DNA-binding NarL/FixJ family response regulator